MRSMWTSQPIGMDVFEIDVPDFTLVVSTMDRQTTKFDFLSNFLAICQHYFVHNA